MRIAGAADDLTGAGVRHAQGARDIFQGRQARALYLCVLAYLYLGVGRASGIPFSDIKKQMPPHGNAVSSNIM